MPPKKADPKKNAPLPGAAFVSITEEELTEAENLPSLNDIVFTNLYAFKMVRNQQRLTQAVKKCFSFTNPEEPGFTEELASKYKTCDIK